MKPQISFASTTTRLAPLAAMLGLLATAGQSAAQSTVSYSFGLPITLQTTELDTGGSLGMFDSDLGTLTSVVLTLRSDYQSGVTISSSAASTVNARYRSTMEFYWSSPTPAVDSLVNTPLDYTIIDTGVQSYTPGQTRTFPTSSGSNSATIDLSSILSQLQTSGGGSFSLDCATLTGNITTGGGANMHPSQSTLAGIAATITYTYTPTSIPEASGSALVLLGGLAFVTRRARR